MSQGWIKLHRKSLDHWLYKNKKPHTKREAWEDMLLLCNHSDQKVLVKGTLVECGRGQSLRSLQTWAEHFSWTKSSTRRFFVLLQKENMIRTESVGKTTRLTVCNYEAYQGDRNGNEPEMNRKRNGTEPEVAPNKNVKNVKNVKNKKPHGDFVKLTDEEFGNLKEKLGESQTGDYIGQLNNYIGSHGKKYKSHYHTILSWFNKNEKKAKASSEDVTSARYSGDYNDQESPLTDLVIDNRDGP